MLVFKQPLVTICPPPELTIASPASIMSDIPQPLPPALEPPALHLLYLRESHVIQNKSIKQILSVFELNNEYMIVVHVIHAPLVTKDERAMFASDSFIQKTLA